MDGWLGFNGILSTQVHVQGIHNNQKQTMQNKAKQNHYDTIRYDTIEEFNVDSKAEYSALSSTRSQKKKLKQTTPVPL